MSASLVGSEMCIRDRSCARHDQACAVMLAWRGPCVRACVCPQCSLVIAHAPTCLPRRSHASHSLCHTRAGAPRACVVEHTDLRACMKAPEATTRVGTCDKWRTHLCERRLHQAPAPRSSHRALLRRCCLG
eukprot:9307521-Alexandrium_andersonii.AAC.1